MISLTTIFFCFVNKGSRILDSLITNMLRNYEFQTKEKMKGYLYQILSSSVVWEFLDKLFGIIKRCHLTLAKRSSEADICKQTGIRNDVKQPLFTKDFKAVLSSSWALGWDICLVGFISSNVLVPHPGNLSYFIPEKI